MAYINFDIGLFDQFNGQAIGASGGKLLVVLAGTRNKATLFDPTNSYAALANPVAFIGGRAKFAIFLIAGQPNPPLVDIFGIDPNGHWFVRLGARPGDPTEIMVNTNLREDVAVFPFSAIDGVAGVEQNTGFDLPLGSMAASPLIVDVTVAQAAKTINVGLLSTQTGGAAAGFANGVSLATAVRLKTTINGGSPTHGTLLQTTSGGGATAVGEAALITTSQRISYTLSAGTTTAEGYISFAYTLTI